MAIKRTGSIFQGIGSSFNKFSQMKSETYDLAPKIALIKKNMEEDRKKREERARVFQMAVSIFSGGMQNLEAQKGIDIGKTLSEGVVPERNLLDKISTFFGGPSGDPTGQFGAIGESAGNQSELERMLEIFAKPEPSRPEVKLPQYEEILPEEEEDLREKSDFRFSIFN